MSGQEPEQSQALTKPAFSELQASALVESVFGFKVAKIQPLPSYDDQNFHVHVPSGGSREYVLKVNNTESSRNADLIEVQSRVMMFLQAEGFPTATVHPTKGGSLTSLMSIDSGSETKSYLLRLFTYLPGRPIAQVPVTPKLLYEVGKLAAQMDRSLEKFRHPKIGSLHRGDFIWNLRNVPLLEKYIHALGPSKNREMVEQVLQRFKDEIVTKLSHFRELIAWTTHTPLVPVSWLHEG
ncbi:hydroxylysine kinase isoform X2 [Antechinus flavipes]|uniref:hydroxylysine kinase isoform X2 n=1 Tax=Antechinus flavipes TaxID=38775 RepID=UPI0022359416|nr:hydroxylysine kinase isoform X2 [Antechinus flavipes]